MTLKDFAATLRYLGIILRSFRMAVRYLRATLKDFRMTLKDFTVTLRYLGIILKSLRMAVRYLRAALKSFGAAPKSSKVPCSLQELKRGGCMIGEINPRAYDCEGRPVNPSASHGGRRQPTERYFLFLAGDLTVRCSSFEEIKAFLRQCRYVSDADQFGIEEYWMHPRHFERLRRGDCEDFALWAWRQLLAMGLDARFVCGKWGSNGHAWVTFSDSQRHYLFEPVARRRKLSLPTLLLYEPKFSLAIRNGSLVYYEHEHRHYSLTPPEWLALALAYARTLALALIGLPWYLVKKAARWRRSPDLKWREVVVTVNDSLPGSESLVQRLLEAGIPVSADLEDLAKPVPKLRLVTFGIGVPPERIRDVIRAAGDFVDFVQITDHASSIVYIGFHRSRAMEEPMAELTPELKEILLGSGLSTADLRDTITSRACRSFTGLPGMAPK